VVPNVKKTDYLDNNDESSYKMLENGPIFELLDRGRFEGALTLNTLFSISGAIPSGHRLFQRGKVDLVPRDGYIKDVRVFDSMHRKRFLFKSMVHIDTIRDLCGQDSVEKLRKFRSIEASAWFMTGGDVEKADERGLFPLLHIFTGSFVEGNSCNWCGTTKSKTGTLFLCSGCKDMYYCSRDCQKQEWSDHKRECQKKKKKRTFSAKVEQIFLRWSASSKFKLSTVPLAINYVQNVALPFQFNEFLLIKAIPASEESLKLMESESESEDTVDSVEHGMFQVVSTEIVSIFALLDLSVKYHTRVLTDIDNNREMLLNTRSIIVIVIVEDSNLLQVYPVGRREDDGTYFYGFPEGQNNQLEIVP